MQQLRRDPIMGRWIIVAQDEIKKPEDYVQESVQKPRAGKFCPFCVGNEDRTPPEIYVNRDPGSGPNEQGWNLRVIATNFLHCVLRVILRVKGSDFLIR